MKIAIDIDDTILEFYKILAEFSNENYSLNINEVELGKDFYRAYNSKEKALEILKDFVDKGNMQKFKLFPDFLDQFAFLNENFELVFVTSRSYDLREKTKEFLEEKLGAEIEIIYSKDYNPYYKSHVCSLFEIRTIVEDFSFNAKDCAEKGMKVLLLDKPWNKEAEHENIFRCKDWREIVEKLKELKESEVIKRDFVRLAKDFVWKECEKETSKYGKDPFEFHFAIVVKYAKILAKEFNADEEILEIAAWMHDIGSIVYGRKDHHITGASIAEKKLKEWGYPKEKIEIVKKCILNHRGSKKATLESVYEKILADADALSNFENIAGILKPAILYEEKNQGEANKEVLRKLEDKYNQLSFDYSKKIIEPKMNAVKVLFGGDNG